MTNAKATKHALISSVVALFLCFTMLLGTTFAWFTDSVISSSNIIKTGRLEVSLEHVDKALTDAGDANWKDASAGAIFDYDKWEPGYTAVKYVKIENEGTLDLKFILNIVPNAAAEEVNLADVIDVYMFEGAVSVNRESLTTDNKAYVGTLTSLMNDADGAARGVLYADEDKGSVYEIYTIALKMSQDAGNEYMDKTVVGGFSIQLLATQLASESDSIGSDYDDKAEYPDIWDGTVGEVPEEENGVITISTAAQMAAFAADVNSGNSYAGKTVVLANDIDLGNRLWTPIGACNTSAYFQGTFDGQGNTIYGLYVDNSTDGYMYSTAGLFGWIDAAAATIKQVNVDGATVKGSHWVGVIAGFMTGKIENCMVSNSTVIGYNVNDDANGDKVGGIVGYMNTGSGSLSGNTVSNSAVTGYRDVAGLAGAVAVGNTVAGNTVEDTVVTYESDYVAAIVSPKTAVVVDESNKADNVTILRGATVTNSEELAAAIANGATAISLADGTYQMPTAAQGKTLTISGTKNAVIEVVPAGQGEAGGQLDYSLDGSKVTFNGVTIKTNSQLYAGYARLSATYNNCVIQNTYNLGVGTSEFNNCEINITNEYLRVGAATTAVFNGCTFNTDGRAILVFQDGTSVAQTVTVKDCTFHATAAANTWNGIHVAAVSIDGTNGTYVVNLEGANTVDSDFNGLWQIKAGEANVTVNQ